MTVEQRGIREQGFSYGLHRIRIVLVAKKMAAGRQMGYPFQKLFVAVMGGAIPVIRQVADGERRLMGDEDVGMVGYLLDKASVAAVLNILHEHRHAIETQAENLNSRVAKVMHVVGQSLNAGCAMHAQVVVARDEDLVLVRQLAEPVHEIASLLFRPLLCKVAGVHQHVGLRQFAQSPVLAVCVGNVEEDHWLLWSDSHSG